MVMSSMVFAHKLTLWMDAAGLHHQASTSAGKAGAKLIQKGAWRWSFGIGRQLGV